MNALHWIALALTAASSADVIVEVRDHGRIILAQGTDKLPGGVEHLPEPGGQSVSPAATAPSTVAPAATPDIEAAPAPAAPTTSLDAASPARENGTQEPAERKSKKSKKTAPVAKGESLYRSMKPQAPKSLPVPGTGGDDRLPGGVEHVPEGSRN